MSQDYSTIDFDSNVIDEKAIKCVELLALKIINKNLNITEKIIQKNDLSKIKTRRELSDKIESPIRLIEIDSIDKTPCGGYHVKNTSSINLIKIIKLENIKGNKTRIYFVSGYRALKDYQNKNNLLDKISISLTTGIDYLYEKIEKNNYEIKEKNENIKTLNKELAFFKLKDMKENPIIIDNLYIIYYPKSDAISKIMQKEINLQKYIYITGNNKKYSIHTEIIDCNNIFNFIKKHYDVKGGGKKDQINIFGEIKIEDIIESIKTIHNLK